MHFDENHITKKNLFMSLAHLVAKRSKDPNTQCGAVIVSPQGRIKSMGYNGMPNGCKNSFSWRSDGEFCDTKYAFVVHAEQNALHNIEESVVGCDMYTTLFPCNECAKAIVQRGIWRVFYWSDKYHNEDWTTAARMILLAAKVQFINMQRDVMWGKELEYVTETN
jgi:dCMP deaminase